MAVPMIACQMQPLTGRQEDAGQGNWGLGVRRLTCTVLQYFSERRRFLGNRACRRHRSTRIQESTDPVNWRTSIVPQDT